MRAHTRIGLGGLGLFALAMVVSGCASGAGRAEDGGASDAGDGGGTMDAFVDPGDDAGRDAGPGEDGGALDAATDAGPEAGAGMDAGTDGGADAGSDAGTDSGTDAGTTCGYECTIDLAAGTDDCGDPVTLDDPATDTATIDMSGRAELVISAELCDPTDWVLHVADSPSCNGFGGDGSDFSNDAEVHLNDVNLAAYSNDYGPGSDPFPFTASDVTSTSGCSTFELVVSDQRVQVPDEGVDWMSEYLLRIDPPSDTEGTPDALWYLGMNRSVGSSSRSGSGVEQVTLCLR